MKVIQRCVYDKEFTHLAISDVYKRQALPSVQALCQTCQPESNSRNAVLYILFQNKKKYLLPFLISNYLQLKAADIQEHTYIELKESQQILLS